MSLPITGSKNNSKRMQIENSGYYLGKIGNSFFVWNEKNLEEISAKNIQEAINTAKNIIRKWNTSNS